jgi:hypothetical protein
MFDANLSEPLLLTYVWLKCVSYTVFLHDASGVPYRSMSVAIQVIVVSFRRRQTTRRRQLSQQPEPGQRRAKLALF